jgi:hypothetical protein
MLNAFIKDEVSLEKQEREIKININNLHEFYIDRIFDNEVYTSSEQKFETQLKEIGGETERSGLIRSRPEKTVLKGIILAENLHQ